MRRVSKKLISTAAIILIIVFILSINGCESKTPPTIELRIYEGPAYASGVCYYQIEALTTGNPEAIVEFSKDDSNGNCGKNKCQVNLSNPLDEYILTATMKNSIGTAQSSITLKWGSIEQIKNEKEIENFKTALNSTNFSEVLKLGIAQSFTNFGNEGRKYLYSLINDDSAIKELEDAYHWNTNEVNLLLENMFAIEDLIFILQTLKSFGWNYNLRHNFLQYISDRPKDTYIYTISVKENVDIYIRFKRVIF